MQSKDEVWQQIERGLGSVGRLRILRALASKEAVSQTRYSLERITGLKPIDVRKHLQVLMDVGWVKEHDVTPPVYTLSHDDSKAQLLFDFFDRMGCL